MLKILTLHWNNADKIDKLYKSLIPSLDGIDYEWYIKDNNSKDNSIQVIESWNNKNVKLFKYPNNLQNFSQGMNYLFSQCNAAPSDFVLLLNNDVIFNDTTSISNMIKIFEDPDVGVVGARLLFTNTNKIQHCGVVFIPGHYLPTHFRAGEASNKNDKLNREFQVVTGAVWLTKAEYYNKICTTNKSGINGLDEILNWAFDDVCACLSIKYGLGKKIIYCGQTNIFHEESASLKKNPANKLFMAHNSNYLREKWASHFKVDISDYNDPNYNLYRKGS